MSPNHQNQPQQQGNIDPRRTPQQNQTKNHVKAQSDPRLSNSSQPRPANVANNKTDKQSDKGKNSATNENSTKADHDVRSKTNANKNSVLYTEKTETKSSHKNQQRSKSCWGRCCEWISFCLKPQQKYREEDTELRQRQGKNKYQKSQSSFNKLTSSKLQSSNTKLSQSSFIEDPNEQFDEFDPSLETSKVSKKIEPDKLDKLGVVAIQQSQNDRSRIGRQPIKSKLKEIKQEEGEKSEVANNFEPQLRETPRYKSSAELYRGSLPEPEKPNYFGAYARYSSNSQLFPKMSSQKFESENRLPDLDIKLSDKINHSLGFKEVKQKTNETGMEEFYNLGSGPLESKINKQKSNVVKVPTPFAMDASKISQKSDSTIKPNKQLKKKDSAQDFDYQPLFQNCQYTPDEITPQFEGFSFKASYKQKNNIYQSRPYVNQEGLRQTVPKGNMDMVKTLKFTNIETPGNLQNNTSNVPYNPHNNQPRPNQRSNPFQRSQNIQNGNNAGSSVGRGAEKNQKSDQKIYSKGCSCQEQSCSNFHCKCRRSNKKCGQHCSCVKACCANMAAIQSQLIPLPTIPIEPGQNQPIYNDDFEEMESEFVPCPNFWANQQAERPQRMDLQIPYKQEGVHPNNGDRLANQSDMINQNPTSTLNSESSKVDKKQNGSVAVMSVNTENLQKLIGLVEQPLVPNKQKLTSSGNDKIQSKAQPEKMRKSNDK